MRHRRPLLGAPHLIRGYIALRRQLRSFAESCNVAWRDVTERHERDEEGYIIRDDDRAEMAFYCNGKQVEVAIFAPSKDKDHRPDGVNVLPLGKLSACIDGQIIKGPLDQATFESIKRAIHG